MSQEKKTNLEDNNDEKVTTKNKSQSPQKNKKKKDKYHQHHQHNNNRQPKPNLDKKQNDKKQNDHNTLNKIDENSESKNNENERKIPQDVRIAVIGNVDSGKSTMIGVLTSGECDDGRGSARSRILRHNHEKSNGRTSC